MKSAIVTISDGLYLPAACCALLSCVRAGRSEASLFLIVDNASPQEVDAARKFLGDSNVPATILPREAEAPGFRVDRWVSLSAYTRLYLDLFFDSSWDRLLYLDADTRVVAPLNPLLMADLRGRIVGAVDDIYDHDLTRIGKSTRYFNSGVLLFDWRATLASSVLKSARQFAQENSQLCEMWDQDALNKILDDAWQPLDIRWNFGKAARAFLPRTRPFILHYTMKKKPWTKDKLPFWLMDAMWYYVVLRRSPWPDFASPPAQSDMIAALRWLWTDYVKGGSKYRLSGDRQRVELTANAGS